MRRKRFRVEQMIGALKQAEVGVPVAESDSEVRDQRAGVLPMESKVCRPGGGPDSSDGTAAGREPPAEAIGCEVHAKDPYERGPTTRMTTRDQARTLNRAPKFGIESLPGEHNVMCSGSPKLRQLLSRLTLWDICLEESDGSNAS